MFNSDRPDPSRAAPSTGPASQTRWSQPNTLAGLTQPAATVQVGEGYLTMSFVWMTLGLLLSAGTAAVVLNLPNVFNTVAQWYIALLLLELVFVIGVSAAINRIGALPGLALFFAFAILNGATLSIIAYVYTERVDRDGLRERGGGLRGGGPVRRGHTPRPDQARRHPLHGPDRPHRDVVRQPLRGR